MTSWNQRRKTLSYKRAYRTQFFKSFGETASLFGWVIFAVLTLHYLLHLHAGRTPTFTIPMLAYAGLAICLLVLGALWSAYGRALSTLSDEDFEKAPRWPPLSILVGLMRDL